MVCFRHPNGMRLGVYALCPTFADKKEKGRSANVREKIADTTEKKRRQAGETTPKNLRRNRIYVILQSYFKIA